MFLATRLVKWFFNDATKFITTFDFLSRVNESRDSVLGSGGAAFCLAANVGLFAHMLRYERVSRWTKWIHLALYVLPVLPSLLQSSAPAYPKRFIDRVLPEAFHAVTQALFVGGPLLLLHSFFLTWTALNTLCTVVIWIQGVSFAVLLLLVEASIYISPLLLLAMTWIHVYRSLLSRFVLRYSPASRARRHAAELQYLASAFSAVDSSYRDLKVELNSLVSASAQERLRATIPPLALDVVFKVEGTVTADAAVTFSTYAEAVLGTNLAPLNPFFRGMSLYLVLRYQGAHRNPLDDLWQHFLRATSQLASAIIGIFDRANLRQSAFSLHTFLPLFTYPGLLALDYIRWRKAQKLPGGTSRNVDDDKEKFQALLNAIVAAASTAEQHALDDNKAALLLPTFFAFQMSEDKVVALQIVTYEMILDAVLDWKNRKNALEIQRLAQD